MLVRKTSAKPARTPGAISGSVTLQKVLPGRPIEGARGFLESRLDADQRCAQAGDRLGQEEHGVGEDEGDDRLVDAGRDAQGEEDQGEGDDDAGQGVANVRGAIDDAGEESRSANDDDRDRD